MLVKRRAVRVIEPGVLQHDYLGVVLDCGREIATGEEGLVEAEVEHEMETRVDVYPAAVRGE